ncbi:MAG: metallophosphoesterase family protein [Verrucomicrobia bacterium]|nr:metallophosphoesterase family protein [Verrucomicrobiota bacterium]
MKRTCLVQLHLAALFAFFAPRAYADKVIRGPYLQSGTPTSVVLRWRTDLPDTSVVRYGTVAHSLTNKATTAGVTTEHVVLLSGLTPATTYFYSVGTTNRLLMGDHRDYFFVTSPLPGTPQPTRIWALGDPGTRTTNQFAVRNAYYRFTGFRPTDLILLLGDNAYATGTDKEYQGAIFDAYSNVLRNTVLWPTLGNHDAGSANSDTQSGVYYDIFTLPTRGQAGGLASGTEAYYAFDYANIHFICLDSHDTDRSPTGAMMTWLKHDLASTRQNWIIAFWHHPPYTKGGHNSDNPKDSDGRMKDMRENALPILEAGGVDLVLTGHSHSYERSFLLDGHYQNSTNFMRSMIKDHGDGRENGAGAYRKPANGPVANTGAVYVVSGSSGQTAKGDFNHPVMFISLQVLGSMVVDVTGNRLDALFLDDRGTQRDHFTILK